METCLIICQSPSGLSILNRVKSKRPIIVVSDDPRVQNTARRMSGISDVAYIEKGESIWCVATDVKMIVEQINEWLASINPSLPKALLAWNIHVEGGFTEQRVQDALLLIRSCLYLFTTFNVREVHLIIDPSTAWESHVIAACAEAKSLPFRWHRTGVLTSWKGALNRVFMPFAKAGYLLFHEALLGAGRPYRAEPKVDLNGTIIFQLCASSLKHVDNVKHIMTALAERGEIPVGLCWSAGGRIVKATGFEQLKAHGISAIGLERFVSLRDVLASIWYAAVTLLNTWQHLRLMCSLRYEGVKLIPLLGESIRYFIIAMLPQRLRYERALRACLSNYSPIAIKPWGGGDFFEGKLALRLLRNGKAPMFIHYWVGASIPDFPYTDLTFRPDVFLAKSAFEAELAMQEYKLNESQVVVVGQTRFAHLSSFVIYNPVETSRLQLKLPLDGKLYVGVDISGPLRGYQTYREQVELVVSVLNAAREVPGLVMVIKPHPSYKIEHLIPLIESYKCESVVLLSKVAPVEHFLNSIDLLITKLSTLILEAALLGRCVITAIFDGEDRFKIFGDLPVLVKSGGELKTLLIQLATDNMSFEIWKRNQLSRQGNRLPKYYHVPEGNSALIAANEIVKRLQKEKPPV